MLDIKGVIAYEFRGTERTDAEFDASGIHKLSLQIGDTALKLEKEGSPKEVMLTPSPAVLPGFRQLFPPLCPPASRSQRIRMPALSEPQ